MAKGGGLGFKSGRQVVTMAMQDSPLTAALIEEVPLPNAPLVSVLSQVKFPLIASIGRQEFIAPFQEAIRDEYPLLRREASQSLTVKADGTVETSTASLWRFSDSESVWRVTLATDFVSVETSRYTDRNDFLRRLRTIVEALAETVKPKHVDRLGVRYIDRVVVSGPSEISELVRPEVAGVLCTPLANDAHVALAESLFRLPEGKGTLMGRWGLLPKGMTVDPVALGSVDVPSWVLDIDASLEMTRPLVVDELMEEARYFAERIYVLFRWAVSDNFLRRFGGDI